MTRFLYHTDEPLHKHWCNKTTDGTPPKDWRTCQGDNCPWGLFERRMFDDGPRVLCREGLIHPRLG